MRKLFVLLEAIILVIFSGCGYTTGGYYYGAKTISILPVENQLNVSAETRKYANYHTFPALIENNLTNAIIDRFNSDGHLKTSSAETAELKLKCVVRGYDKTVLRYTDADDIEEQKLSLSTHVTLTGPNGELLKEKDVTGETTYFLSGQNAKTELAARVDLIEDTSRRILDAVTEQW